jgi:hypothetical protein
MSGHSSHLLGTVDEISEFLHEGRGVWAWIDPETRISERSTYISSVETSTGQNNLGRWQRLGQTSDLHEVCVQFLITLCTKFREISCLDGYKHRPQFMRIHGLKLRQKKERII